MECLACGVSALQLYLHEALCEQPRCEQHLKRRLAAQHPKHTASYTMLAVQGPGRRPATCRGPGPAACRVHSPSCPQPSLLPGRCEHRRQLGCILQQHDHAQHRPRVRLLKSACCAQLARTCGSGGPGLVSSKLPKQAAKCLSTALSQKLLCLGLSLSLSLLAVRHARSLTAQRQPWIGCHSSYLCFWAAGGGACRLKWTGQRS